MRALIVLAMAAAATPAAAQDAMLQHYIAEAQVEQEMSRQRDVALRNELSTLEARVRTEIAITELERQREPLRLPLAEDPRKPAPAPETFAAIPDDRLAASNARVRAAAKGR